MSILIGNQIRTLAQTVVTIMVLISVLNCSSTDNALETGADRIVLDFGNSLLFEENGELGQQRIIIERIVRETISLVNEKMFVDNLKIRILVNSPYIIPEIGIGGYNPSDDEVVLALAPGYPSLQESIESRLGPMLAHEMHHVKRRRTIGYGTTLLEACVSEGLADSFSIEIFGFDPPIWSIALTEIEIENWIDVADDIWTITPYDHENWFFGSGPDIPRWTGYSIGFKLAKEYLDSNPSRDSSDLFDEPADSFVQ